MSGSSLTPYTYNPILFNGLLSVDTNVVFWSPSVEVGDVAAFQVSLTAPNSISVSSISFVSAIIYLEDGPPIIVRHSADKKQNTSAVQWHDAGEISMSSRNPVEIGAVLQWNLGDVLIVSGRIISDKPTELKVFLSHTNLIELD